MPPEEAIAKFLDRLRIQLQRTFLRDEQIRAVIEAAAPEVVKHYLRGQ